MARPYTRTEAIRKLITQDVSRVEEYARYVLIIDEEGNPRALVRRDGAPLNIIAILGPAWHKGEFFPVALLLEVGLGQTRPYHSARFPQSISKKRQWIEQRRNYRLFSPERFRVLCPYLLDILADHAREIIALWKHREWKISFMKRRIFSATSTPRNLFVTTKESTHLRGVRIAVSFSDTELLRIFVSLDVSRLCSGIKKGADLLMYCLKHYKCSRTAEYLKLYSKAKASRLRLLVESFGPKPGREYGRLPPHHVAYMYARSWIPEAKRALFEQCAEVFSLVNMDNVRHFGTEEHWYSFDMPDPAFTVWILPDRRKSADYMVCEIIPKDIFPDCSIETGEEDGEIIV